MLLAEPKPARHRGWLMVLVGADVAGACILTSWLAAELVPAYSWRILWLPTNLRKPGFVEADAILRNRAVLSVYGAEHYPTEIRSTGPGLCAGACKAGGVLIFAMVCRQIMPPTMAGIALIGAVSMALAVLALARFSLRGKPWVAWCRASMAPGCEPQQAAAGQVQVVAPKTSGSSSRASPPRWNRATMRWASDSCTTTLRSRRYLVSPTSSSTAGARSPSHSWPAGAGSPTRRCAGAGPRRRRARGRSWAPPPQDTAVPIKLQRRSIIIAAPAPHCARPAVSPLHHLPRFTTYPGVGHGARCGLFDRLLAQRRPAAIGHPKRP